MKTVGSGVNVKGLTLSAKCVLFLMFSAPAFAQHVITTYAGGGLPPVEGGLAVTQFFDPATGVVPDGLGGFYFSVAGPASRVYRVLADGTLKIIAGLNPQGFGGDNGPAPLSSLNSPSGLARDGNGNLFIADQANHRVRRISPTGIINTVAGNGARAFFGDGGAATLAALANPSDVAVDGSGNLYVLDRGNNRIRKITADGIISTVAGDGIAGFSGDGGPATAAHIDAQGIASDAAGNLFLAHSNNRVRKIAIDGVISTVAGRAGPPGVSGDGGPATSAQLVIPRDVDVDPSGNLLIVDGSRIRRVDAAGIILTVAGTSVLGFSGDGSTATSAQIHPMRVAADNAGNLFIADSGNYRIRKIDPNRIITTVAGTGTLGFSGDNGPASAALFNYPGALAMDRSGNLFIADTQNDRIRKITPSGIVTTFAGNGGRAGGGDGGPATSANLNLPIGVAVDTAGNVFIVDCNNRLRKVTTDGVIRAFSAGTWGFCGLSYSPGDSPRGGSGIAADVSGNVYVSDRLGNRVYKVASSGEITLLAGTGISGFSGDGGPATSARLAAPLGLAVDTAGNVYIADSRNYRIRKLAPNGVISTVAGNGTFAFAGDNGPATQASIQPVGVAVDVEGNLLIADTGTSRIRKVTAGIITTIAGTGSFGFSGDDGPATSARLDGPMGVTVDAFGNVYIADTNNHRIRRLNVVAPALTKISPNFGDPSGSVTVTLSGRNFLGPLTVNAGPSITVTNVNILSDTVATATLSIDPGATPGVRTLTVTNAVGTSNVGAFNIGPPFPDVAVNGSHGPLGIGFEGTLHTSVTNVGSLVTSGPIALTETLPAGLTFVSGGGSGWSCSASGQAVSCLTVESLAPGDSTMVTLTVAVGGDAASTVMHAPSVETAGDLGVSNNAVSDMAEIVNPGIDFSFSLGNAAAGKTANVGLTLTRAFPRDLTGTLRLSFSSNAGIPADDPAIQFITGGREIPFSIPANTQIARFDNVGTVPLAFQSGTVAGTLTFTTTLQSGTVQKVFSTNQIIPMQPPVVKSVSLTDGVLVVTTLSSPREITHLFMTFSTTPPVRLSCGAAAGCTAFGNMLTLDVKSLFDSWYSADTTFGSLSTVRVPLTIQGTIVGTISVAVRNSLGQSNGLVVPVR